uniref:Regulatory protein zeste n=1 Tax=Timema tahoe TaxID=61484 RepID=A0A7R9IJ55_9NEOP|nr:unnamed protein product [Timema tahoe]
MAEKARNPPMSEEERTYLLEQIVKFPILENKKSDVGTIAAKKRAWMEITRIFNSNANFQKRAKISSNSAAGSNALLSCWTRLPKIGVRSQSGIGSVEFRGSEPAFAWRESGKPFRKIHPPVHLTEIRTSISPSSAVELNTTIALANYANEAGLVAITLKL